MLHRILLTGASGYLGGTLLARWASANLPPYDKLYALVRTDNQANSVREYGAEALNFDINDAAATREAVIENKITVVFFLINAFKADSQVPIIKALAEVKKMTGKEVHFLHVIIQLAYRVPLSRLCHESNHEKRLVDPRYFPAMLAHQPIGHSWTMNQIFTRFKSPRNRISLQSSR